ncbi:molybdenum cofactor cytidylyltransferase [Yokenella regensburgei]|uniref:Molybdenum cofactor cytidylyltransferase n=1 Tax=Yokenella regensburgei TaxID=158877 RepID=A0ABX9RV28_9ENTR|nr:NTP transferase domain-containing protein [Yokenella regensburgei]RKR53873.1 molybdenum cofactor cytidylyltransferase [Yokenella regensburgei]VFS32847.1 molybdopterin-guanine dinucleotide biosynthesis protein A [Yokenella regensburgei]
MQQVDCIITAAGLSSRMGQWKMMLPWRDGTILDASIKNALQFCSRIILVTGHRSDELHEKYAGRGNISLVYNADYATGLFSSVKAGATIVNTDYCFITLGDVPCLPQSVFHTLWSLRGAEALLPEHGGTPGHPILLSRERLQHTVSQTSYSSMRKALLASPHRRIDVGDRGIIFDIDTPNDFINLQTIYRD